MNNKRLFHNFRNAYRYLKKDKAILINGEEVTTKRRFIYYMLKAVIYKKK